MQARSENKEETKKHGIIFSIVKMVIMVVAVIVMAFLLRTFVFDVYEIPSGSMIDTLEIGDRIIAEKVSYYSQEPERGDIVTFEDPLVPGRTLIKRVIATEGQVVDFNDDGKVVVDGVILYEPYTDGKESIPFQETAPDVDISYPYTVPDGCIWVMGDNRTNSEDSRYFGAVPVDSVYSKAVFRMWPLNRVGTLE